MSVQLRRFTMQELCADDTRLHFYLKSIENNDYFINDRLGVKRHALATLFHTSLSRSLNPSLFILNNTIIDRDANEVAEIIAKYRPHQANEPVAQLILFSRSDDGFRGLFKNHYKRIECRANHNQVNIIETNVERRGQ